MHHHITWDGRLFVAGGKVIRFPRGQAQVFDALWRSRSRGGIHSREHFMQAVYGNDPNGGPDNPNVINVQLTRMRRRLEGSGYTITRNKNQNAMNGYRIESVSQ